MGPTRFALQGEYIELNQLLKLAGACNSGGEGKMLVAQGMVQVNGVTELRKTYKVRVGDAIRYRDLDVQVVADDAGIDP